MSSDSSPAAEPPRQALTAESGPAWAEVFQGLKLVGDLLVLRPPSDQPFVPALWVASASFGAGLQGNNFYVVGDTPRCLPSELFCIEAPTDNGWQAVARPRHSVDLIRPDGATTRVLAVPPLDTVDLFDLPRPGDALINAQFYSDEAAGCEPILVVFRQDQHAETRAYRIKPGSLAKSVGHAYWFLTPDNTPVMVVSSGADERCVLVLAPPYRPSAA